MEEKEEEEKEDEAKSVPSNSSQLVIFGARTKLTRAFRFD